MRQLVSPNTLRANFSAALSQLYQQEIPAYGTLLQIVHQTNTHTSHTTNVKDSDRMHVERHGAIRLGTAKELSQIRRVFRVLGMEPVSYYDLSTAGIPVHSTAFRPTSHKDLQINPFRVFTSLLRLDLIADTQLRDQVALILAQRPSIVSPQALALTNRAESQGGLDEADGNEFVQELLETFRWRPNTLVDSETFRKLESTHRLVADVVSFAGPHLNHLTPRTLDIDDSFARMKTAGVKPKETIEGPPRRACPILLRQTAFAAVREAIVFSDGAQGWHTARFGEIEQRGAALTRTGRALYDRLLEQAQRGDGPYTERLQAAFAAFPDDWRELHDQELAYFEYQLGSTTNTTSAVVAVENTSVRDLLDAGVLVLGPITYEDFLPVSAAGIFRSNLGNQARCNEGQTKSTDMGQRDFEDALGQSVIDEFELYARIQTESLDACLEQLRQ